MDEDKLNKQLNDRIRDVFDHYEDTTADEGWAALSQKFPVEQKDRGFAWLWYAAAAVVLLGIGLWFMVPAEQTQQMAGNVKVDTKQPATVKDDIRDSVTNVQDPNVISGPSTVVPQQPTANTGSATPSQQIVATRSSVSSYQPKGKGNSTILRSPITTGNIIAAVPNNTPAPNTTGQAAKTEIETKPVAESTERYAVAANAKAEAGKEKEQVRIDSPLRNAEVIANNKPVQKPLTSAEAMARMLAQDKPQSEKLAAKKTDKKTVIGIYAGTFFNYADGSDNRVNVGGGITTDLSITRNFKLSTGVSIAQNSLNYNYDVYKGSQLYAAALDVGLDAKSAALSYSAPIPKNYRASLIGLDVPINLKYQFDPKKHDTYVSAGVSSGTFLNETYVLDYNVGATKEQTTTQAKFSDFYLAKTLNVSFGVGYPLGKSNRLVIEPFLKYPLGGLGTQQIKFGSGGVNLRLNFSGGK